MYRCELCGNQNMNLFGFNKGELYCRKCISFSGKRVEKNKSECINHKYIMDYSLTKEQKTISNNILKSFKDKKDCLVHAVCGAGKTELVFKTISYALSKLMKVGITIPRKDVVIELLPRFQKVFNKSNVVAIYGGNTEELKGDIVILTTHQLYRYSDYFDLLIIDETDAFPFYGNETLNNIFLKSIKGNFVMLSATPTEEMIRLIKQNGGVYLTLNKRYHNRAIPIPIIIVNETNLINDLINNLKRFYLSGRPTLVFVPTIETGMKLHMLLKNILNKGNLVHSKSVDRDQIIQDFKKGKYLYLITTSVLERGITISNLQVIIYSADHSVFDKKTLIQIAGRVGRKINSTFGEVLFLSKRKTTSMKEAIDEITISNK